MKTDLKLINKIWPEEAKLSFNCPSLAKYMGQMKYYTNCLSCKKKLLSMNTIELNKFAVHMLCQLYESVMHSCDVSRECDGILHYQVDMGVRR